MYYPPLEQIKRTEVLEYLTRALKLAGTGLAFTQFDDDGDTVVLTFEDGLEKRVNVCSDTPIELIKNVVFLI